MTTTIDGNSGVIFPNSTTQASAGQVLQVVSGYFSTFSSTTSTSQTTTGMSLNITTKQPNSRIVFIGSIGSNPNQGTTATNVTIFTLKRNSSQINQWQHRVTKYVTGQNGDYDVNISLNYLDAAGVATGTTLTYELFYGVNNSGDNVRVNDNTKSYIILQEIAA